MRSARWRSLLIAWVLYITVLWGCAWLAGRNLPGVRVRDPAGPVARLSVWDGEHYQSIAQHGYTTEVRRVAFFPLYPALARALGGREHAALAGILLSQLLLLACMLLFSAWRAPDAPPDLRSEPGFWLLFSPVGFFMAVLYNEALLLFLVLAALALLKRERAGAAWTALFLSGLTRPTAITLPALFLRDVIRTRARRLRPLLLAAAPLAGIALYVAYVGVITGDPLGYTHVQHQYWRHEWRLPFVPALQDLDNAIGYLVAGVLPPAHDLLRPAVLCAIAALLGFGWRRLEPDLRIYLIASLAFIHSHLPSGSSARYDLALFPVYILMARSGLARSRFAWPAAAALAAAQLYFLREFLNTGWVS